MPLISYWYHNSMVYLLVIKKHSFWKCSSMNHNECSDCGSAMRTLIIFNIYISLTSTTGVAGLVPLAFLLLPIYLYRIPYILFFTKQQLYAKGMLTIYTVYIAHFIKAKICLISVLSRWQHCPSKVWDRKSLAYTLLSG